MNCLPLHTANDPRVAPYARVKDAQLRDWGTAGLFMAESLPVICAALRAGYRPQSMLVEEALLPKVSAALDGLWPAAAPAPDERLLAGTGAAALDGSRLTIAPATPALDGLRPAAAPVYVASHEVFAQVTGYETVRAPLVAFERKPLRAPRELIKGACRIAVLEDVGNYANIGAAFRAAHAFGVEAVLVTPSCHDPLFRRALRHSQGTVLQVPWTRIGHAREWAAEGVPLLHDAGFKVAALALSDDSLSLDAPELASQEKLALVLGTEGEGLFPSTIAAADYTVKIPMAHEVDSLNVAAASAVAFWELRAR